MQKSRDTPTAKQAWNNMMIIESSSASFEGSTMLGQEVTPPSRRDPWITPKGCYQFQNVVSVAPPRAFICNRENNRRCHWDDVFVKRMTSFLLLRGVPGTHWISLISVLSIMPLELENISRVVCKGIAGSHRKTVNEHYWFAVLEHVHGRGSAGMTGKENNQNT